MTKDHLQLHGQPLDSCEESKGSRSGWIGGAGAGGSWLDLKQVIAQKDGQGKELSSKLIQHPELRPNFKAGLCWILSSKHTT